MRRTTTSSNSKLSSTHNFATFLLVPAKLYDLSFVERNPRASGSIEKDVLVGVVFILCFYAI